MTNQFVPRHVIVFITFFLAVLTLYAVHLATEHPWLGFELESGKAGVEIVKVFENSPAEKAGLQQGQIILQISVNGLTPVDLDSSDLMIEPDDHASYKNYLDFFEKQSKIFQLLQNQRLTVFTSDGEYNVYPGTSKPVSALSIYFWFQLFCAYSVLVMGALVWSYSQKEMGSRFYMLAAFGLLVAIVPSAIYTTRELALDGEFFHYLSMTNQLGVMLFTGPGTAIFWFYPKPINRFPILYLIAFLVVFFLVANYMQVYESLDYAVRLPIVFWLLLDIYFGVMQWHKSKADPVSRAQLKWFIIAWVSGPIVYVALNIIPLLIGYEPVITQKTGWFLFVLVYMGMALGLRRYRLFNLDRWILNAWFWLLCGAGVVLFDIVLFASLGLDHDESVVVSLAVVGWIYFPLRQYVFNRVAGKNMQYSGHELLPGLLNILLTRSQTEAPQVLWPKLLEQMYKPLHLEFIEDKGVSKARIENDGQSILLPIQSESSVIRMYHANKGERLFAPDDAQMLDAISRLYKHVIDFQYAQLQGAKKERKRLARDLHDDVSSKVLSLIYRSDTEENAQLGRDTLDELRNVINDLENGKLSLQENLFEWQCETRQRCGEVGIELCWQQTGDLKDKQLSSEEKTSLRRILREAVSNVIKHAHATKVDIDFCYANSQLQMKIKDNGKGFEVVNVKKGHGLINMQRRAREMGALIKIESTPGQGNLLSIEICLLVETVGFHNE